MAAPWEQDWQEPQIPEVGAQVPAGAPGDTVDRRPRYEDGQLKDPVDYTVNAVQQTGSALDNLARMIANGFTAGGADAFAAKMNDKTGLDTRGGSSMEGQQFQSDLAAQELGPVLSTGGEIAGGMAQGALIPGGMLNTIPKAAATGMLTGAANTAAQSYFDTGELPSLPEVLPGAIFGLAAGAGGAALGKIFQRPRLNVSQEDNANLLSKEGVDVTSGQATNNPKLLKEEGKANGSWQFAQKQSEQYSKAALKRANIISDTGRVDPETIVQSFEHVGKQMDALAARNNMQFKVNPNGRIDVLDDLRSIAKTYHDSVQGGPAKIIDNTVRDIAKAASQGVLTGQKYQEITSALSAAARSNPALATTAHEMRMAISHAMEDYISSTNQADAGLWKAVNRQYANLLIVENAMGRAGAQAADGIITPASLQAATKAVRGTRAYARGKTDFDDLIRAGVATGVGKLPSTTFGVNDLPKYLASKIATFAPAAAGFGAAYGAGGSPAMMAAGMAGTMGMGAVNAARNSTRLTPVNELNPLATQIGGRLGASLGMGVGPELPNPFLKASGQ